MLVKPIFNILRKITEKEFAKNILIGLFLLLILNFFVNVVNGTQDRKRNTEKFYIPESFEMTFDELDEIKEMADDRTRNYGEILDDISAKCDEIKSNAINDYKYGEEDNADKELERMYEQEW